MKDIRTTNQLLDSLNGASAWRKKEIADLRILVKGGTNKSSLARFAIPIVYAHFEGFVKEAATYYLAFVRGSRYKAMELLPCFFVLSVRSQLREFEKTKKVDALIAHMNVLEHKLTMKPKFEYETIIDTESNLKSSVFENILVSLGLDVNHYSTKFHFIDSELLKWRNAIAHGMNTDKEFGDLSPVFDQLAMQVYQLINQFMNNLIDAAANKKFLRR